MYPSCSDGPGERTSLDGGGEILPGEDDAGSIPVFSASVPKDDSDATSPDKDDAGVPLPSEGDADSTPAAGTHLSVLVLTDDAGILLG